jgi:hypothetical protein
MSGNTAPLIQYRENQEKPWAYIVNCYQQLPTDRINTPDNHLPDDRIINIKVTRSYIGGRPNESDLLADMSRAEYEQWRDKLEANGSLVVGMIGTRRIAEPTTH